MKEKILNITLYIEFFIFIIVGTVLKLTTKINILFNGWWLIIIMIPLLSNILFRKNRINSFLILLIVTSFLLYFLKVIDLNKCFIIIACLAIIYIGINIIKNILFTPNYETTNNDINFYNTILGEDIEKLNNVTFNGCTIWTLFGNMTLDLVNAKIEEDSFIKVFNLFGSTNIITDDNIDIIKNGKTIIGDSNNLKNNKTRKKNKILKIKSLNILGSLKVK